MFGTIRRHQNWLWAVIITVIILTFVVWFSPDVRFGGAGRPTADDLGSIDGKMIPPDEYQAAEIEARLNYFMRSGGKWPTGSTVEENLKRDTVTRVLLIRKAKEMGIRVSSKAVSRLARERLGDNVVNNLGTFEKEYLAQGGVSLEGLSRYLEHEAGIQQMLQAASAGAKLINPQEAESLFRQEHEKLATEVAVFSATNYLGKVNLTPEAVTNYYARQQAQYRLPERIQVAYVTYPVTNFLGEADKQMAQNTNLNAAIDELYFKQGPDTFKDTNGAKLPEAEAKARIKEEARHDFALREARRKAIEFGTELYNQEVLKEADFERLAAAKGLEVKVTPPFDRVKGLEEKDFPASFAERAFALTEQQPVSVQPVVGTNAVYVLALKNKVASELPTFEQIRDKVTEDYRHAQAVELARKEGNLFRSGMTNALAQKKTFAEAAAEAKAQLVDVPPFSAATTLTNLQAEINGRVLQNVAAGLKPGETSQFLRTEEGGMVVYLRERIPVSNEQVKQGLPEFVGRLRFYRQNEAFNQWFGRQAEMAKLRPPKKEPASTPGSGPPRAPKK